MIESIAPSGALADFAFLQRLSGRKQGAAVIRWLVKNKIPYVLQASGHPVASMDAINQVLHPQQPLAQPVAAIRFDLIEPAGRYREQQKKQKQERLAGEAAERTKPR